MAVARAMVARPVGMTRHQTRAAIAWESVLIGLLGTGLGVLIGVFFGWATSVTVRFAFVNEVRDHVITDHRRHVHEFLPVTPHELPQ